MSWIYLSYAGYSSGDGITPIKGSSWVLPLHPTLWVGRRGNTNMYRSLQKLARMCIFFVHGTIYTILSVTSPSFQWPPLQSWILTAVTIINCNYSTNYQNNNYNIHHLVFAINIFIRVEYSLQMTLSVFCHMERLSLEALFSSIKIFPHSLTPFLSPTSVPSTTGSILCRHTVQTFSDRF